MNLLVLRQIYVEFKENIDDFKIKFYLYTMIKSKLH